MPSSTPQGDTDSGGFKASMLFQEGGTLDWEALKKLQAPNLQLPLRPRQPAEEQRPALQPEAAAASGAAAAPGQLPRAAHIGTLWGLLVLSLAYLHHSTSGFALPALLPIISEDLHLSDTQGALLTAGYTVSARW